MIEEVLKAAGTCYGNDLISLYTVDKKNLREFPGGLAVKDLALSLLWCGFEAQPREHAMDMAKNKQTNKQTKKTQKTNKQKNQKKQKLDEMDVDILRLIVTINIPLFSLFFYLQNMITVGLYQVAVLINKYFFLFSFSFYGHAYGIWKFPG